MTKAQYKIIGRMQGGEQLFCDPDMNTASGWRWSFGSEPSPALNERTCKALLFGEFIKVVGRNGMSLAYGLTNKGLVTPADHQLSHRADKSCWCNPVVIPV